MGTFKTVYGYECKKLLQKKLTWISFLLCMIGLILNVTASMTTDYYVEGEKIGSNYEIFQKDREYARALNGREINQQLLEETIEAYHKIPLNFEGHYTQTPEYEKYARPYSQVFNFIAQTTNLMPSELISKWHPDENAFYSARQEWLEECWKNSGLSEKERKFWREEENKIEKPIVFWEHEGADKLMQSLQTVGILTLMFIGIALSGTFSEEHVRKTDALILSSASGKTKLYKAKILAGMTVAGGVTLIFSIVTWVLTLWIYGTGGFEAAFQIYYTQSSDSITYGQALFIAYGCLFATALLTAMFVMVLSECFRSSIASLAVITALILASMIINIPSQYRIPSQIWAWLPTCFIVPWNIFGTYTIQIFQHCLPPWQAVPCIYLLSTVILFGTGKAFYKRCQIKGR